MLPERNSRSRPHSAWAFRLLMVPFLALAVHQWGWPPAGVDGDWAQYLLHAKALLEGRPYGDTGYIFHPDAWMVGPTAYPPGLPVTLVPLVAMFGMNMAVFRLLMIASLLGFAWLAWRRLALRVDPWVAAVGAGFAVLTIEGKWATLAPISDPGFAALLWATVLVVDTTATWTWRRLLLVTAFGGACMAYRMAGIAVAAAYGVWVLLTWRSHRGRAAVPLVLWGLGALVAAVAIINPADLLGLLVGSRNILPDVGTLVRQYGQSLPIAMLRPTPITLVNRVYYVFGTFAILVGLVPMARWFGRSFLAAVCVMYVLLLAVAPVGEERYLWPLYPVIACTLAVGLHRIVEWVPLIPPTLSRYRITLGLLALVAFAALATETARPRPEAVVGTPNGEALFAWLRQTNALSPIRVTFFNPRVAVLHTGVAAMGNVDRSPRGHLKTYAEQGITHIVCQPDEKSDEFQRQTNAVPQTFPDRFELAYRNPEYIVYRVLPRPLPESKDR